MTVLDSLDNLARRSQNFQHRPLVPRMGDHFHWKQRRNVVSKYEGAREKEKGNTQERLTELENHEAKQAPSSETEPTWNEARQQRMSNN